MTWLSEDFPVEIIRCQIFNPIHRRAIEKGHKAGLSVDKLYVDGKMYTVDTVNQLPELLQLSEVHTKRSEHYTAFYTKHTPLSNHHPAKFTVDSIPFDHSEQFYYYHKAKDNGDRELADHILNMGDASQCYKLHQMIVVFVNYKMFVNTCPMLVCINVNCCPLKLSVSFRLHICMHVFIT